MSEVFRVELMCVQGLWKLTMSLIEIKKLRLRNKNDKFELKRIADCMIMWI